MKQEHHNSSRKTKVLVVEDSPTQAQQLIWLLENEGYETELAKNGVEALELLDKQLPDLLITDVVMPEMNGYQLCESVRDTHGMDVPIMLVTSLSSSKDVLKGLKVGADNFLKKPYQASYLLDQVSYLMANRKLRGQRKMELGIEIEFVGERHFITADRQQILDLLISTYHEAVNLNQKLEENSKQLETKINLQSKQLQLSSALQDCTSDSEILEKVCDLLVPLRQFSSMWYSVQADSGQWQQRVGQLPNHRLPNDSLELCNCILEMSKSNYTFYPHRCELSKSLSNEAWHLCLPITVDGKHSYLLNFLLPADYGNYDDISDHISTIKLLIEANIQRVRLLNELESRVEKRTKELQASERNFRAMIDSNLFGVMVFAEEGQATYQNSAALKIMGNTPNKQDFIQSLIFKDAASLGAGVSKEQTGLCFKQPVNTVISRPDGENVPIIIRFSSINNNATLATFIDMSDLKRAESKLESMQRLDSIASLSGGVAHDFNNLLSIILGNTDVLLDASSTAKELHSSSLMIQKAAQSGADLTRQLLAFARCQPLTPETINVNQVLTGLEQFFERLIGDQINIKINCNENLWPVYTDYSQLERVILNLAINARDAMPAGGQLHISAINAHNVNEQETFSNELIKGDFVKVIICDTGTGIPEDILSKVFEPFFTTKEDGKGTGLGLAMAHGFVKQSEGFLQVHSKPGETCFKLYFPADKKHAKVNLAGEKKELVLGDGQHILLVEDNSELRTVMARHIKSLGYHCTEVSDYDTANMTLLNEDLKFSLVLTDFKLNGPHTGVDLIKDIAQKWPSLPVALITGSTIDVDPKTRDALSNFSILKKPFRRHHLASLIDKMLTK